MPSRRNRKKSKSAGIAGFMKWWWRELSALVPPSLRLKDRPPAAMLWVSLESGRLALWRLAGKKRLDAGWIDLNAGSPEDHRIAFDAIRAKQKTSVIGICIDPKRVLRKEVVFPLTVAENLTQVLSFELGRLTPFSADQAYFDGRVLHEDLGGNQLRAELVVAPKMVVDETLGRLRDWGVSPGAVVVLDQLMGVDDCVNLLPLAARPRASALAYWRYIAMAGLSLLLLVAVLFIPLWQKREMVVALQPLVQQAKTQADAVDDLRKELEALRAEYNYPHEKKHRGPSTVVVLDEVARLLPDDTWLQQLDIHGEEVSMQGFSKSSSRLVGLFEKSNWMGEASFKSPLVKIQGGEERFQLAANLKELPLPAFVPESKPDDGDKAKQTVDGAKSRGDAPRGAREGRR